MKPKVFLIHGHDSSSLADLKLLLTSEGVSPVILSEQDDRGLTIIEKFEYYANECDFAFALLTPDDKQAHELGAGEKWRARQNVILELGWFMSKLSRRRTALLHKGSVELPSDVLGVVYIPFSQSVYEAVEKIRQRLRGVGVLPP